MRSLAYGVNLGTCEQARCSSFSSLAKAVLTIFRRFQGAADQQVTRQPSRGNDAIFDGLLQLAAWLFLMFAIAKTAAAQKGPEFDEAVEQSLWLHMPESEFADAGRVDQVAALRQMKQPRGGRGMAALDFAV